MNLVRMTKHSQHHLLVILKAAFKVDVNLNCLPSATECNKRFFWKQFKKVRECSYIDTNNNTEKNSVQSTVSGIVELRH